jgi:branched-chain amino acid transport system permease protein
MAVSAQSTTIPKSGLRSRKLLPIAILLLAFLYPFIDKALGIGQIGPMEGILIFAILAMGLNIVVGYAGLLDLGYAAFFAIGAYANAFLTSPASYFVRKDWVPEFMRNFWVALTVSWVAAAIFGVLLGAPTLRLRGDYLAIVTLGFGEIVPNFFLNAEKFTGGTQGLNPIAKPTTNFPGSHDLSLSAVNQRGWYYLILIVLLFSLFIILRFKDSRMGRSWVAIREDEIAAASMGVNLTRTKLWAFAMGASFAGFAGSIFASAFQIVNPDQFLFSVSVMILAMVVLGGMGNIYGAILGALLIGGFDRILSKELNRPMHWIGENLNLAPLAEHDLGRDRFMVFGLALVITMLLRPEGLLPNERRKREMHDTFENPGDVGVPLAGFEEVVK